MQRPNVREVARNRWLGILPALGVNADFSGRQAPCPICPDGGKDRFRFDNLDGRGTWICNRCGAGDGFDLLMRLRGTDFPSTAKDVLAAAGAAPVVSSAKREFTEDERKKALNELWIAGRPVTRGDVVDRYLRARCIDLADVPADLRTIDECPVSKVPGVRTLPAMLAMVRGVDGKPLTLHRTYLGDGCKANIEAPRRVFPGPLPKGSAIRLFEVTGGALGIAEGIETALAAAALFDMPVWSAINSTLLSGFRPPEGVTELAIFADNDASFGGQAAAYQLAHSVCGSIDVTVSAPPVTGHDWVDVLAARRAAKAT